MPSSKKQTSKRTSEVLAATRQTWKANKHQGAQAKALGAAMRHIDELEARLEAHETIRSHPIEPCTVRAKKSHSGRTEAVAVMVASDWHVESVTTKGETNGINEFNPEIATKRAKAFFTNGLRLRDIFAQSTKINTIVLPLLGDFTDNDIHAELAESASMLPMEAILFAQNLIAGGIDFLLNNSSCNLVVPCHSGNHARTTKKVHVATEHGHSLEFMMYQNLAARYAKEPRVTFRIPKAAISYYRTWDMNIRFMHGHFTRSGGGIGGLTIPLNKYIARQDQAIPADLTILGHYHTLFDGGRFLVNGSLCGYNAYAQANGFSPEPPAQAFLLISGHRGGSKSAMAPIWLDK